MKKYLDLFEKDMKKLNADYFVEQIQFYKNMYTHYKNTSCPSPIYTGILNHGDTHCFYFPTNENVNLTWDVDLIYKKFLKFNSTSEKSPASAGGEMNRHLCHQPVTIGM